MSERETMGERGGKSERERERHLCWWLPVSLGKAGETGPTLTAVEMTTPLGVGHLTVATPTAPQALMHEYHARTCTYKLFKHVCTLHRATCTCTV